MRFLLLFTMALFFLFTGCEDGNPTSSKANPRDTTRTDDTTNTEDPSTEDPEDTTVITPTDPLTDLERMQGRWVMIESITQSPMMSETVSVSEAESPMYLEITETSMISYQQEPQGVTIDTVEISSGASLDETLMSLAGEEVEGMGGISIDVNIGEDAFDVTISGSFEMVGQIAAFKLSMKFVEYTGELPPPSWGVVPNDSEDTTSTNPADPNQQAGEFEGKWIIVEHKSTLLGVETIETFTESEAYSILEITDTSLASYQDEGIATVKSIVDFQAGSSPEEAFEDEMKELAAGDVTATFSRDGGNLVVEIIMTETGLEDYPDVDNVIVEYKTTFAPYTGEVPPADWPEVATAESFYMSTKQGSGTFFSKGAFGQ
ncbi:MAG: hypothetical protein ACOC41_09575 [Chitinivibrionales bacterium]